MVGLRRPRKPRRTAAAALNEPGVQLSVTGNLSALDGSGAEAVEAVRSTATTTAAANESRPQGQSSYSLFDGGFYMDNCGNVDMLEAFMLWLRSGPTSESTSSFLGSGWRGDRSNLRFPVV